MIKVKDGYGKLIGTTYKGSADHLLRSNGDTWAVHTGRNNEANKIVRTDSNGQLQVGWINTTSGNLGTANITRIYCSNDNYIRYKTPENFFSTLSNNGDNISITVASQNRTLVVGYSKVAGQLRSKGTISPQTGRTQSLGDVYSYHLNGSVSGGPTKYASVIGFGRGTSGTVEIAGEWTSGRGLWVRALRDTTDNWYAWDKVLTQATYTGITDSRYYTKTQADERFVNITGDTMTGELINSSANAYRLKQSNYGVILRNDNNSFWILPTNSGSPSGSYNSLRPFRINLPDGRVTIGNGLSVTGTIVGSSTIQGTQLISTIANGTAPLKVTSKTVVTNLNSDLLDGYHETSFFRTRGSQTIAGSIPTTTELSSNNNLSGNWNVTFPGASGHLVQFNTGSGSTRYMQFYSHYSGSLYWRNSTDSTLSTKSWKTIVDSANYTGIVLKIGTATKGSATLPIYLNAGTPTACSTTLRVSITGNAATATKLQTARTINGTSFNGTANITTAYWGATRTITLSGAVTGSASVNGSQNVTITTTYQTGSIDGRYVGGKKAAGHGSQGTAYTADTYSSNFVNKAFVAYAERGSWSYANNGYITTNTGVNIPLAGTAVFQWGASNTNKTQLFITPHNNSGVSNPATNEMLFYTSNGSGYTSAWTRVLTHRNYTTYTVTKTGGGASGTWGISITGNANTATKLNSRGRLTALSGTNAGETGLSMYEAYSNGYPSAFGNLIHLGGSSAAGRGELLLGWAGSNGGYASVYYRNKRDVSTANWSSWVTLLDSTNHTGILTGYFRYLGENINANWNSITTQGNVRITNQTITNGPTGAYTYGQLLTFNAGGTLSQIYLPHSNTQGMYIRTGWSGVSQYYSWIQMLTSANYYTFLEKYKTASYSTTAMHSSGYYKIAINSYTSWMMYFRIRVYKSYSYFDIDVSGYNYGAQHWYQPKAKLVSSDQASIQVRFGYDSNYHLWVAIPYGNYTGITIYDVVNGYTQAAKEGLFTISYVTSLSGSTQSTITAYRSVSLGGDIMYGTLTTYTTGTGAYNQGIRINRTALNQWATLTIGYVGTGTSGTSANTWLIGTPANSNSLVFNLNTANAAVGLCLKGHGNTDMKWNNNTVWHAGNDGSGSGLDADLLDGVHNGYVTANHLYIAGSVSNFNTLTGNGIYSWGANVTGQPNNYGSVFQFSNVNNPIPGTSNHWVTQLASSTNNRLYYRTRTNTGGWNSWRTLAFTTDVPTVTNYYWANIKVSASSSTSTSPTFSTAYTSNWFRSNGKTGWYSQTYGGGIYMTDSSYVRVYGSKRFYAASGYLSPYGGGPWISMATRTNCIVADQNNSASAAHALFRVKNSSGHAIAFGGLGANIGFYGFYASRISSVANGIDWSTVWNVGTGVITHSKTIYTAGYYHSSVNSNNYVLLAGGSYKNLADFAKGNAGSSTQGVYVTSGTVKAMTYKLNATVNSGSSGKLAYYSGTNSIDDYTSTKGSSSTPIYLNAGVPTACSGVIVKYWGWYSISCYSSTTPTYSKKGGNFNFVTSVSRRSEGKYTVGTVYPSGYTQNNTIYWGSGRLNKTMSSNSANSLLYVTMLSGYQSGSTYYLYVNTADDSSSNDGMFDVFFLCF